MKSNLEFPVNLTFGYQSESLSVKKLRNYANLKLGIPYAKLIFNCVKAYCNMGSFLSTTLKKFYVKWVLILDTRISNLYNLQIGAIIHIYFFENQFRRNILFRSKVHMNEWYEHQHRFTWDYCKEKNRNHVDRNHIAVLLFFVQYILRQYIINPYLKKITINL